MNLKTKFVFNIEINIDIHSVETTQIKIKHEDSWIKNYKEETIS